MGWRFDVTEDGELAEMASFQLSPVPVSAVSAGYPGW